MKTFNLIKFKKHSLFLLLLFYISFLLFGCNIFGRDVKIALSKGSEHKGYEKYAEWLKKIDSDVDCTDLYNLSLKDALDELDDCDGLLLTGGPDVHPARYGKGWDTLRCEIDKRRDTLEFLLIKKAMEKKIPILGICRGEQILNVALGGTLIVDIPQDYDTMIVHRCGNPDTCFHEVKVLDGSLLKKLTGTSIAMVNTNHHQAVDKIADGLLVTARTRDGLIEAYEWSKPEGKSFLLAVQWHPERLEDNNPMSMPIGKYFIGQSKKFKKRK
ncbi:MAG: gamma-glutamyl-gamma-aminobutyrate hydrolase family protein [Bacteroidetes bacterium]|nr:MAG: gamma-glutamyl-gamma-aminobutyrate hydrolase family protein [Bacteroidota bacterium]